MGNWSGAGSSISLSGLLGQSSSPLDHLRAGLARGKPDWVLAGLNDGANIGRMIMCSGTVCLAAYAADEGIPAMALSQHRGATPCFRNAAERLRVVLDLLLKRPPPAGCFWNVNLPMAGTDFKGAIGCAEMGRGGYIPKAICNITTEFVNEWVSASEPERLLERGYAVVQLIQTFRALDGKLGEGKGLGGAQEDRA
jgi:broad specificity polyphosphatase/5'/3'-nucleotidase SurE